MQNWLEREKRRQNQKEEEEEVKLCDNHSPIFIFMVELQNEDEKGSG